MANVKIVKSDPPETKEILADAIIRISDGFTALQKSGLNMRAIILLIKDQTNLPMRDIELVLKTLPRLKGWYCR